MKYFCFRNVLAAFFIFAVITEGLTFIFVLRSPFGYHGAFTYINHARKGITQKQVNRQAHQIARTLKVKVADCDWAQQRLNDIGRHQGIQAVVYEQVIKSFGRSGKVWPILLTLWIVALGISAVFSMRAFLSETGSVYQPLGNPVARSNKKAVDKVLFK